MQRVLKSPLLRDAKAIRIGFSCRPGLAREGSPGCVCSSSRASISSLLHGIEAVVDAGGGLPLPDDLAEVVDPIDLGVVGVRVVDRSVGAVAQYEAVCPPSADVYRPTI